MSAPATPPTNIIKAARIIVMGFMAIKGNATLLYRAPPSVVSEAGAVGLALPNFPVA